MRPLKQRGRELEAFSNRLISRIIGLRPMEEESKASFCIRRNSAVAQLKRKVGFSMRFRWCQKLVSWVEHIRRHHDSLAYSFSTAQGDDWLRERRAEVGAFGISRSLDAGETKKRMGRGAPHRFFSGWLEALDAQCDGLCTNPLVQSTTQTCCIA